MAVSLGLKDCTQNVPMNGFLGLVVGLAKGGAYKILVFEEES
jgi:hypothetical protein